MNEEIKNQLNILELVNMLGLKVTKSGFIHSIYKAEKNPSLKLYPQTNSFYCFSTNQGGDVIKFYMDYFNISYSQAIQELSKLVNPGKTEKSPLTIHRKNNTIISSANIENLTLLESEKEYFEERAAIIEYEGGLPKKEAETLAYTLIRQKRIDIQKNIYEQLYYFCNSNINPYALEYLTSKKRGLRLSTIKYFRIFSINDVKETIEFLKDNFSNDELIISGLFTQNNFFIFTYHTIIIPYIENDKINYLRGRYFYNNSYEPNKHGKYISLHNFAQNLTSKRFYNIDLLEKINLYQDIVITEGEFDCMIFNQSGINSIGIPGVSNFPVNLLHKLELFNVYLCYDNDSAGQLAVNTIAAHFNMPIKVIKIKNFKDITEVYNAINK
ncbi:MAG: CHC2 zinc finger domain-containing protein [Candidatus Aenigmatarchaeota archaeon]